jgi:RHS repeat-associated protein
MRMSYSYTRDPDPSGSLEGAGGIGGLLARSAGYSSGNWTSHAYYHGDGNGNITCLVDGTQAVAASYRYDPFGNLISKSGTLADANLYRFSSKEFHVNSGVYYYLYRFYDPNTQRWLNRDPIADQGSVLALSQRYGKFVRRASDKASPNIYLFVSNNPLTKTDPDGREVLNYGCSGGTPTCWSPLQPGPPPPRPDPCTSRGGHYEPYWKIMGYSDLSSCATAEWQLIRDTVGGGLGAVGGTICAGGYGGIAGAVGGTLLIPVAICSQQICVFN